MLATIKSYLKASRLYPHYVAWQRDWPEALSDDDYKYISLYAPFVRPDSLVFDIGANVGARAKAFRHLRCRVIAVEPQRNCVAALKRTFGGSIVRAAVSDRDGNGDLHVSHFNTVMAGSSERLIRIESLIDHFGCPDLISIDVKGHELAALDGSSVNILALSFELTPELQSNFLACIARLSHLGTYVFNFSASKTGEHRFPTWIGYNDIKRELHGLKGGYIFAKRVR